MSDTTRDPIIASRSPLPWLSWQRSEDYYSEGQLMWLDVDTRIRELSGEARSLDTFAERFFGRAEGGYAPTSTYDFAEVVQTLESVESYDWAAFLTEKLETTKPGAPLDGIERGGYRLEYRKTPSSFARDSDKLFEVVSLRFSIGITVAADGKVREVLWESPAFEAGLTTGSQLLAVNGRGYSADELKHAIVAAEGGAPVELLIKRGKHHCLATIHYHDGLRYPHLEPIEGARRRIDEIYAPR